jgi:hypothetical protein
MSEERGFKLNELKLDFVLSKVPTGIPISVVSVVGAFRTGKSFLLDLFLRYLRYGAATARVHGRADGVAGGEYEGEEDTSRGAAAEWLRHDGGHLEGNVASGASDFVVNTAATAGGKKVGGAGFKWRYGNDRQTTGMWLWSEPFIRLLPNGGGKVAVLLMDTQGLFDSKVAQMLTTQIFGLSTLLSSYQIFNVCPRLTENELQNVAVFAEFARIAATGVGNEEEEEGEDVDTTTTTATATATTAKISTEKVQQVSGSGSGGSSGGVMSGVKETATGATATTGDPTTTKATPSTKKVPLPVSNKRGVARLSSLRELMRGTAEDPPLPVFQRLEFLVRDSVIQSLSSSVDAADAEMAVYIRSIFGNASHEDLRVVREQILTVFESTSCYLLPHPGHVVTEDASFDGSIDSIRPQFLSLLDRYVRVVFCEQLEPKVACGRALSAGDFKTFVRAYALAFSDASKFPEARVLFDATTDANNRAAMDAALAVFHKLIAERTRHGADFVEDIELKSALGQAQAAALALFTSMASFGPPRSIRNARLDLEANISDLTRDTLAQNDVLGAPAKASAAAALVPTLFVLWAMRLFLDFSCAPFFDVCKRVSLVLSFLWLLIFAFVAYSLYQVAVQSTLGVAGVLKGVMGTVAGVATLVSDAAVGKGLLRPTTPTTTAATATTATSAVAAATLLMPNAKVSGESDVGGGGLRRRRGD